MTVLAVAGFAEMRYIGPCTMSQVVVVFDDDDGKGAVGVDSILDGHQIPIAGRLTETLEDGRIRLHLSYCSAHKHHKDFLSSLASLSVVRVIER